MTLPAIAAAEPLLPLLTPDMQHAAIRIDALRQAQAVITDAATTAQVYGRIDDLIRIEQHGLADAYAQHCAAQRDRTHRG